jgi:uncharacterized protein involved in propanediol utilization
LIAFESLSHCHKLNAERLPKQGCDSLLTLALKENGLSDVDEFDSGKIGGCMLNHLENEDQARVPA